MPIIEFTQIDGKSLLRLKFAGISLFFLIMISIKKYKKIPNQVWKLLILIQ